MDSSGLAGRGGTRPTANSGVARASGPLNPGVAVTARGHPGNQHLAVMVPRERYRARSHRRWPANPVGPLHDVTIMDPRCPNWRRRSLRPPRGGDEGARRLHRPAASAARVPDPSRGANQRGRLARDGPGSLGSGRRHRRRGRGGGAAPGDRSRILRPRAFAVLRLMTSSNFVGWSIGRSPGLAPLRILSP